MPGAAIHAFWEPVTTRSRPQASISNGTAPRALIASTRMSASGATSRTAAASSGIGFVTPVEVSLWVRRTALRVRLLEERRPDGGRRGGLAPLDLEAADVGAVDLGDLREAVAEGADGDGEDPVAGREDVDDGGLEGAGARGGEQDDVGLGAEERAHPADDPLHERGELGAAVVDHLAPAGGHDGRREGGRAGDPEVLLEAGHGFGLLRRRWGCRVLGRGVGAG